MKLFRLVSLFFLLFTGFFSLAQDKEKVIQHIRDRYYRINGGDLELEHYQVGELKVTEENDQIVIIKEPTPDGVFEYYFDGAFKSKRPYFIYFETNQQSYKPYLRAYFNSQGDFVWFKKNDKEVELNNYRNPYHYLYLQAVNAWYTANNKNIKADPKKEEIDQYVNEINQLDKKIDTVSYMSVPNEGNYSEWDFEFYSKEGHKVMKRSGSGGEHGSDQIISYFKDRSKVFERSESSTWFGSYDNAVIELEYFENEKIFRKEKRKSYGTNISDNMNDENPYWFDISKVVPEITVF